MADTHTSTACSSDVQKVSKALPIHSVLPVQWLCSNTKITSTKHASINPVRRSTRKRKTTTQAAEEASTRKAIRIAQSLNRKLVARAKREAKSLANPRMKPPLNWLQPVPYAQRLKQGISEWQYAKCNLQPEPDSPPAIIERVAKMLEQHKGSVVVHSGAGISVAAGIPDFRGHRGVWTLQRNNQNRHHADDGISRSSHTAGARGDARPSASACASASARKSKENGSGSRSQQTVVPQAGFSHARPTHAHRLIQVSIYFPLSIALPPSIGVQTCEDFIVLLGLSFFCCDSYLPVPSTGWPAGLSAAL